jgi:hypothetical protein
MRALRSELGREKADAIVKEALRDWSKQLFKAIGDGVDGSPRRKWAAMHTAFAEITERDVTVDMHAWAARAPMLFMVIERFRNRDPKPIYRRLRRLRIFGQRDKLKADRSKGA